MDKLINEGDTFGTFKLKRNNMVKPLVFINWSSKTKDANMIVDSSQLFQRIVCTVRTSPELEQCFTFELAAVPLSIFDERGLMKKTKKSSLYQLFKSVPERSFDKANCLYVLDGGNLIHRVLWPSQSTFKDIYEAYVNFVRRYYGEKVTIVFDGYSNNPTSTKSIERQQRILKRTSPKVIFEENTPITDTKEKLLSNLVNKERFISQLVHAFQMKR